MRLLNKQEIIKDFKPCPSATEWVNAELIKAKIYNPKSTKN